MKMLSVIETGWGMENPIADLAPSYVIFRPPGDGWPPSPPTHPPGNGGGGGGGGGVIITACDTIVSIPIGTK